jgi:general secretion pathway protein G
MEERFAPNPFPPPPRRLGAPLLLLAMGIAALAGIAYLGWMVVAGDTPVNVPTGPNPDGEAITDVQTLGTALDSFKKNVGRYPTAAEGLDALVNRPAGLPEEVLWVPMKMRKALPLDPWGRAYQYEVISKDPPVVRVFSLGENASDPKDDISVKVPAQ